MRAIKDWVAKRPEKAERQTNFPPVTGSLRKLTVCTAFALLERFDCTMERGNKSSLVADITSLRTRGFTANDLLEMVHRQGDPDLATGKDKLNFLVFGSPALRYILYQVSRTCYLNPLPTNQENFSRRTCPYQHNSGSFHAISRT